MEVSDLTMFLNKRQIIKKMRALIFFLPIGFMTNHFFQRKFPDNYTMAKNTDDFIAALFTQETLFIVCVYCGISLVAFFIESTLFPIMLNFSGVIKSKKNRVYMEKYFEPFANKLYGENFRNLVIEKKINKSFWHHSQSETAMILILWILCFSQSYIALSLVALIILSLWVGGMSVSAYYKNNIDNEHN